MKYIKKYIKYIAIFFFLAILILLALFLKEVFFPKEAKVIYGTRLEEIEGKEITSEVQNNIKEALKPSSKEVDIRITGKLVYITVDTNDDISRDAAKGFATTILEQLPDEIKALYDINLIINNSVNTEQFPIMAYKHHTKTAFVWTKDRG